jgi:hypothetical protein
LLYRLRPVDASGAAARREEDAPLRG